MRAVRVDCGQREMTFDISRPPFRSADDAGECLCARNDLMRPGPFAIEISQPSAWPVMSQSGAEELSGSLDEQRELGTLSVLRDRVASYRGGEAALRADREPLSVDHGAGLAQPVLDLSHRLEFRRLGGDQPEHDNFVLRDRPERVEAARSLVVVLEQQPVSGDLAEDWACDRIVGTGNQPPAELVASAQVKAEGGRAPGRDDRVVKLDAV